MERANTEATVPIKGRMDIIAVYDDFDELSLVFNWRCAAARFVMAQNERRLARGSLIKAFRQGNVP